MKTKIEIKITKFQADAVEWALGAMDDYWDGSGHGRLLGPAGPDELPRLDGTTLLLSHRDDIADDLAYRVGDQLVDMTRAEAGADISEAQAGGQIRSLEALAEKIRRAFV
jgi:hypothetical protein